VSIRSLTRAGSSGLVVIKRRKKIAPKQRECCQLRLNAGWKIASIDTLGDQFDEWLAGASLEMVVEPAKVGVALRAVDQGGKARGERGFGGDLCDMAQDAFKSLAGATGVKFRAHFLMEGLESVADEPELALPMAINGRLSDPCPSGDRLDGERAKAHLSKLIKRRSKNRSSRLIDTRIDLSAEAPHGHSLLMPQAPVDKAIISIVPSGPTQGGDRPQYWARTVPQGSPKDLPKGFACRLRPEGRRFGSGILPP
jgi:hypothetical protein